MAAIGLVIRLVVYVVVISASSSALYGIVTSQKKTESKMFFGGSQCLLFAKYGFQPPGFDKKFMQAGADGWCKFVEFSAGAQLALAGSMAIYAIVRLFRRSSNSRDPGIGSLVEMVLVSGAFLVALAGGSITSAGVGLTCNRLLNSWNNEQSVYKNWHWHKPSSCEDAFVFTYNYRPKEVTSHYKFYNHLNIAQISLWVTCIWLLHVLLSAGAAYRYIQRRKEPVSYERQL